jgi:hypothetical protein
MQSLRLSNIGRNLAATLAIGLTVTGVAVADVLLNPDADSVAGIQGTKTFSSVAPGAVLTPDLTSSDPRVVVGIDCNGSSHLARGTEVGFAYSASDSVVPAGGGLSAADATVTIPNTWPLSSGSCSGVAPATATSNVTVTVPNPAAAGASLSYTVGYTTPNDPTLPSQIRNKTQTVTYTVEVANVAPVISNFQGDESAVDGDTKSYTFDVVDDNGGSPTKSLEVKAVDGDGNESDPAIGAVSTSGLDVTYNVPGTYKVRAVASDGVNTVKSAPKTVEVAASNTAPHDVGTPALAAGSSTPNKGVFGLDWTAATDDEGDTLSYALQHKDSNDLAYSGVAGAGALGTNAFGFAAATPEAEGTWTYRVQASDGSLSSAWSSDSASVVVDRTAPSAPTASFNKSAISGWYKDSVIVSYAGSSDPALPDASAGSGVAGYATDDSFTTSGTHNYSGTATDNAGNESTATSGSVQVDADAPSVGISGCPTSAVEIGSTHGVSVTASDLESGLASDPSGNASLDTSTIGSHTYTATASDVVGHSNSESCTYTVVYGFAGFLAPINGNAVNAGKTGRTYPIKWQLLDANRNPIADEVAQGLVAGMTGGQKAVTCGEFFLAPTDTLESSTTGGTALRYDATSDQFIYNYKAPTTQGCYVFAIRNADGAMTKQVAFTFTK